MDNEQTIHANDLDSLIGDNHLQMMKAALPYMNVPQQRLISFFVKFNELRRTIDLFEEGEVAAMGICSLGEEERSDSPINMLNTIKPFADPSEQDFIDLMINFIQGFKLAGTYSDPILSSRVPVQAQSEGQNRQNSHRQTNPFARMPMDQIKNFMSPELQSRFDTMQMMMSAIQQMT